MSILALNEGTINVNDISELATIDISFFNNGSLASVTTLSDLFYLDKTSALPVDNITVVLTSTGTGRWIRTLSYNLKWSKQAVWYIDGVNGDDENSGLTQSTALRSLKEWSRRVGSNSIETDVTVYILEDVVSSSSDMFYLNLNITDSGKLTITGELSNISSVYSGTISNLTTCDPLNNQPWEISLSDPSISDNFWNSHVYNNLSERLRTFNNSSPSRDGYVAWAAKDLFTYGGQSKTCRVSQPIKASYVSSYSQALGSFEISDNFLIERLPRVGGTFSVNIASTDQSPKFILKDIATDENCKLIIYTNNSPDKSCLSFDSDLSCSKFIGSFSFINCKYSSFEVRADNGLVEMYGGLSNSNVDLYGENINLDFRFMIQGNSLNRYSPSSSLKIGSLQVYDASDSAIVFYANSSGLFLPLHGDLEVFGNNNTVSGIRILESAMPRYKNDYQGINIAGNIADLIIGLDYSDPSTHYQYSNLPVIDADTSIINGVNFVNSISGFIASV